MDAKEAAQRIDWVQKLIDGNIAGIDKMLIELMEYVPEVKVWIDDPLIHSAGIRTCSWECSRKLYGIKVMPHTRVAQYNTRLLDKDEGGSG